MNRFSALYLWLSAFMMGQAPIQPGRNGTKQTLSEREVLKNNGW